MDSGARSGGLNRRQQLFVQEYLIDLNATAAYRRAGYQPRTDNAAYVSAHQLLRLPKVAVAVDAAMAERRKRLQLTADDVLGELAHLGRSDIGDILDFTGTDPQLRPVNQIPERARRAIASVKVKRYWEGYGDDARQVEVTEFKLWDKLSALEKVGKHLGLYVDRHEHAGPNGGAIPVSPVNPDGTKYDGGLSPAALAAFAADILAAGLGDVPPDDGGCGPHAGPPAE
jgi:phage terminase small subunit